MTRQPVRRVTASKATIARLLVALFKAPPDPSAWHRYDEDMTSLKPIQASGVRRSDRLPDPSSTPIIGTKGGRGNVLAQHPGTGRRLVGLLVYGTAEPCPVARRARYKPGKCNAMARVGIAREIVLSQFAVAHGSAGMSTIWSEVHKQLF